MPTLRLNENKSATFLSLLLVLTLCGIAAEGATLPGGFTEVQVASGISNPTAMQFTPDGRLFVAEQTGKLRVIKDGALLPTPFVSLTVNANGERGLLGVAFDPNFAINNFVYVYYTATTPSVHNRVSRFTANGDVAVPGSEVVIFDLDNLSSATNHNGGALAFGPFDGKLYVSVGENANSANSQSLNTVLGKVLRINSDGTIPSDNPFYGVATGKNRAIWALGLRNPFTFAFDPLGGALYINDVGETSWEEINEGAAGANYGWPSSEGSTTNPSFTTPKHSYSHNNGVCAITGGAFYSPQSPRFPADYETDYFFADYCAGWIRRLDVSTGTVTTFASGISAPVDLKVSADGDLYYLARNDGAVYRVTYGDDRPAISAHPQSQTVAAGESATFSVRASGAAPLRYQWLRNGAVISGANSADFTIVAAAVDTGARFSANVSNAIDPVGATSREAILTVSANRPPTGTIVDPVAGALYSGGAVIAYSGTATDPDDGTLPASAFTWQVDLHHDTHFHPFVPATSGARSGSFTIPTTGETSANVWYRIHLTVRDANGLIHTTQRDIYPRKIVVSFATTPPGLQLTLDGQPLATPSSIDAVVGVARTLGAAPTQVSGGNTYTFGSWSDGGAASHTISTPATNTTYTATYQTGAAPAAISLVQHVAKDAGTTTSSTLSFPSANVAGNWVAVAVRSWPAGQTLTVSDSRGNVYRRAVQLNETADGMTLAVFYAENITGGTNTVTVRNSQSGTLRFAIQEFSGVALAGSLDVVAGAQGTSAAPSSGVITTTSSGSLVIGLVGTANPRTLAPGSAAVLRDQVPAAPNGKFFVTELRQTSPGPVSAGGTMNTGDVWGAVVATFKAAATSSSSDLTLAKTHAGTFLRGSWATYSLVATNRGASPTTGQVTVVDTLPPGLSATAIVGDGWSCSLATVTCSRGDALAAGASYPPLTLTVFVAADAPASVTNSAAVSGGGDGASGNNAAADPTTIANPPTAAELRIAKTHAGSFTAGQTGATYSLVVTNAGAGPTAGTVTVVDTLPAGLSATALAGTGWTCALQTLTCTRSDSLASALSYPTITLTVNVAAGAPSSLINYATVSGGGDVDSTNNSTADQTAIVAGSQTDSQPPTAPTALTAAIGNQSRIDLSWSPASDNVGVTAYRVEQCKGAGCSDFTEVSSLEPPAATMGPLRVSANPNYFADPTGKPLVLNGSHTWNNLQDWGTNGAVQTLDFDAYVDFLVAHGHNFTMLWYIELPKFCGFPTTSGTPPDFTVGPHPWQRTGPGNATDGAPRFDLTKFNQAYFDRLRARVEKLKNAGIYAGVYVFTAEWVGRYRCSTDGYPFTGANNINGINDGGGTNSFTMGSPNAITAVQDAYVEKVIDTLNDLPNVLWMVSEEAPLNSNWWNDHQIAHIRTYESGKPLKHPIGYGTLADLGDAVVTNSDADWISPGSRESPTTSCGTGTPRCKVNVNDSDHSFFGLWNYDSQAHRNFAWQNFMTGNQAMFMDPYVLSYTREGRNPCASPTRGICAAPDPRYDNFRDNFGYILRYSRKLNLANVTPQRSLCSTGYCLAQTPSLGAEYLVYAPNGGSFTVNLSAMSSARTLNVEWFNPSTGATISGSPVQAGSASRTFTPPFSGDAVLYLVDALGHAGALSASSSYAAENLTAGTYRFRVRAVDAAGNVGPYSNIASASIGAGDTNPPSSPGAVTATLQGGNDIRVAWTPSTDDVGVAGYVVERCQGVGCSTFVRVSTPGASASSFIDSGLAPSTSYSYRVAATDAGLNQSAFSSVATAMTAGQAVGGIVMAQHVSKDAGSVTSSTLAFPAANVAGNWIAIVVRSWPAGQTISVSDTRGNVYRSAVQYAETVDGMTLAIFYAENVAGGANTVTVRNSLTGTLRFALLEYSGVAKTGSLETTAGAQGTSAAPNAAASASAANLVIGVVGTANERVLTPGIGFVVQERVPNAQSSKFFVEDLRQGASGSVAALGQLNSSEIWAAVVATFRAAPSSP